MVVRTRNTLLSPLYFVVGVLTVAPFRVVLGEDLTLFPSVMVLGALVGGWALLSVLRDLRRYEASSSICRWSVRLMVWSVMAFLLYPLYAWAADLPLDFLRAAMSVSVSVLLSLFFFLGLRIQQWPGRHLSFLFGAITTGVVYLGYLVYVIWESGLLFTPYFLEARVAAYEAIPTWPSRYPVVLLMLAFAALAVRMEMSGNRSRSVMLIISGMFALAVIYSLTRGAWIGLAASLLVLIVYCLPEWKWSVLLTGLVVVLSVGTDVQGRFNLFFPVDGMIESSTAIRLAIWGKSVEALMQSPVLGYGQQGTGVILGDVESELDVVSGAAAHNDYIDMAIRSGFPGLVMYLALAGSLFLFGLRRASAVRRELFPAYLVVGLIAGLAYGLSHEFLRLPISAALFWYLAGSLAHEQAVGSRFWARSFKRSQIGAEQVRSAAG